jgi:LuxR family maltose regulon positive regulatory protein
MPVAWISLEGEDSDLARFLQYIITAVNPNLDDFGTSTLAMLQQRTLPTFDQLATPLINELAVADIEIVIVLDDYHFIDEQSVHHTVAFFLDHIPATIHLVISARSDPPLPLAGLRGAGELVELRAADLRFSPEEAASFLAKPLGIELSEEAVAALSDQVEGWAVGLQLAGLALRGREDPQAFIDEFSGSHRYVVDFLTDEVLLQQSDEIRQFLLETSILDSLNPDLCDSVTSQSESRDFLLKLETSNLFIVPLDDRREWYRYHRLFRDALNYRLAEHASKQFTRELHRRAAAWYQRHEFKDEALRHWMLAEEHEDAANLIETEGHRMLASAQLNKLQRWIEALPSELVRERPWLSIQYAWILNLTGQLEDMELRLQDAERALPREDQVLARMLIGNIATIRAGAARKQHNSQTAIEYLQEALANLPEDDVLVRSSAHFNLGSTLLDIGEAAEGEHQLRAALSGAETTDHVYTLIAGTSYLADSYVLQGLIRKGARTYEQAISESLKRNSGQPLPLAGYAHSGLGRVLYEQDMLEDAKHHLGLALELSERLADWTISRRCLPTLARLQQVLGLKEEAKASWGRALELSQQYDDKFGEAYLEAYRARLWMELAAREADTAALASASRWAEGYRSSPHDVEDYRETFAQITLAWIEVLEGEADQTLHRLDLMADVAESHGRIDCLIKILACVALAQTEKGQTDLALSALRRAFEFAQPEGYSRAFIDFGPSMVDLIQKDADGGIHAGYADSLLKSSSIQWHYDPSISLAEPLTDRELEVLKLLAAGYSNQEISDDLVIALGTVQQYNHIIFRTLEVRTRVEAAARAKELHLI